MKTYIKNKNEMHLFIFLVICLTFFAGFFYAYNDSVWVWMFWGMAVILLQNSKEIHKSKNSLIRELNK